jgi:hypothetical protein
MERPDDDRVPEATDATAEYRSEEERDPSGRHDRRGEMNCLAEDLERRSLPKERAPDVEREGRELAGERRERFRRSEVGQAYAVADDVIERGDEEEREEPDARKEHREDRPPPPSGRVRISHEQALEAPDDRCRLAVLGWRQRASACRGPSSPTVWSASPTRFRASPCGVLLAQRPRSLIPSSGCLVAIADSLGGPRPRRRRQGVIDILEEIVGVLDADRETNGPREDSRPLPLGGGEREV